MSSTLSDAPDPGVSGRNGERLDSERRGTESPISPMLSVILSRKRQVEVRLSRTGFCAFDALALRNAQLPTRIAREWKSPEKRRRHHGQNQSRQNKERANDYQRRKRESEECADVGDNQICASLVLKIRPMPLISFFRWLLASSLFAGIRPQERGILVAL